MKETPLNKLKSEESELERNFQELGRKFHAVVREGRLEKIRDDVSLVELLGEIEERRRHIEAISNSVEKPGKNEEA